MRPLLRAWLPGRRRTLAVSAGSLVLVRLAGLASQVLAATTFGASAKLDAFYIALIVPSMISVTLVAGGELAFSPKAARLGDATAEAAAFRRRVTRLFCVIGAGAAILATAAAPVLVWVSAPGADGAVHDEATSLAYLLYPMLAATVAAGGGSALLIGSGRIHLPALFQLIRPFLMVVVLAGFGDPTVRQLAGAVLVGAFLEALLTLAAVRVVLGGTTRAHADDGSFDEARRDFGPLAATSGITQLGPVADQAFAASLGPGRLVTFILAVRFYDIGKTVLIQPAARLAQNALAQCRDRPAFAAVFAVERRRLAVAGLTSAALLGVVGPPVILLVFVHGDFSPGDAHATVRILVVLALALVPFAVSGLLQRALISLGRSRTVTKILVVYTLASVALDAALVGWIGAVGIAVSTLTALTIVVLVQLAVLRKALAAGSGLAVPPQLEGEERP